MITKPGSKVLGVVTALTRGFFAVCRAFFHGITSIWASLFGTNRNTARRAPAEQGPQAGTAARRNASESMVGTNRNTAPRAPAEQKRRAKRMTPAEREDRISEINLSDTQMQQRFSQSAPAQITSPMEADTFPDERFTISKANETHVSLNKINIEYAQALTGKNPQARVAVREKLNTLISQMKFSDIRTKYWLRQHWLRDSAQPQTVPAQTELKQSEEKARTCAVSTKPLAPLGPAN